MTKYRDGLLLGSRSGLFSLSNNLDHYDSIHGKNSNWLENAQVRSIIVDSNEKIILGTMNQGVFYYTFSDKSYSRSQLSRELGEYPVWNLDYANDTTVLVSTDGAGIYSIGRRSDITYYHYVFNQDNESSLGSNVVHNILVLSNSIWIATTDIGGISLFNPQKPDFKLIKRTKGSSNTLRNNVIHV